MAVFEELALIYDQSINWKQRLQHELPLLTSLIKDQKSARILDLACGSGRHAVALAQRNHEVVGLDISSEMIAAATRHAENTKVNVQFHTANMRDAKATVKGPFDLILCLGNSLALLPSIDLLKTTLRSAYSLLTKNGLLITQILNFEEIRSTQFRFFPLKSGTTASGNEVIFARFFEPMMASSHATLVFTGFIKTEDGWKTKSHTQQVLQLTLSTMEQLYDDAGFSRTQFFADYQKGEFQPTESRNLISLVQK